MRTAAGLSVAVVGVLATGVASAASWPARAPQRLTVPALASGQGARPVARMAVAGGSAAAGSVAALPVADGAPGAGCAPDRLLVTLVAAPTRRVGTANASWSVTNLAAAACRLPGGAWQVQAGDGLVRAARCLSGCPTDTVLAPGMRVGSLAVLAAPPGAPGGPAAALLWAGTGAVTYQAALPGVEAD